MTIEQQLEKARIWALWSYIGLVVPVAGIIASLVSLSILRRLVIADTDTDALEEQAAITELANIGKSLSILFIVITIVGGIFVGVSIGNALSASQSQPAVNPYVSGAVGEDN